jgi:hypothetical protein
LDGAVAAPAPAEVLVLDPVDVAKADILQDLGVSSVSSKAPESLWASVPASSRSAAKTKGSESKTRGVSASVHPVASPDQSPFFYGAQAKAAVDGDVISCECGVTFGTVEALQRHLSTYAKDPYVRHGPRIPDTAVSP